MTMEPTDGEIHEKPSFEIMRVGEFAFACRPDSTDEKIVHEVISSKVYSRAGLHVGPGDTVFDIGAHIGSFSVWAAKQGAYVFCYEPTRKSFQLLAQNVRLNEVEGQLKCHRLGVMGTAGAREIFIRDINYGGSNFYYGHPGHGEQVTCTTLKAEFDKYEIERCDFLKLDCEDAEYEVIKDFPYLDRVKQIAIEYVGEERRTELVSLLYKNGFELEVIPPGTNNIGFIYATQALPDVGDLV